MTAASLEGERCWYSKRLRAAADSDSMHGKGGGGGNNGIYFFIRDLGGSQAFQSLALEFFDFSIVHND